VLIFLDGVSGGADGLGVVPGPGVLVSGCNCLEMREGAQLMAP